MSALKTLEWWVEAGVTDLISDIPNNYFSLTKQHIPAESLSDLRYEETMPRKSAAAESVSKFQTKPKLLSASLTDAIGEARKLADEAKTLQDLHAAVANFNGCPLKKTANKTVFADGNPKSEVMVIGEAPGADEDREGLPFVGMSGKLLDKVLASIKLTRKGSHGENFYITNTIFWRPPGNRKPTPEELAICEPFLEKHIALVNPKILVLVGATAVTAVLKRNDSMGKLRSQVFKYKNDYMKNEVDVMVTYHPSFLLRAPLNKRLAWEDMLFLQDHIVTKVSK